MSKKLDLSRSVFELVQEYPELVEILAGLGFTEVRKKAMLRSMGRMMTIPKGAVKMRIPMSEVVMTLMSNGFELEGEMPTITLKEETDTQRAEGEPDMDTPEMARRKLLKDYLRRLGEGEDLEAVRADFAEHFRDVDASEIMSAEQELMAEGTPLQEVQKLCDVHSALFHGATKEERIAAAERSLGIPTWNGPVADYSNKNERAAELGALPGHPLYRFNKENRGLERVIAGTRDALASGDDTGDWLKQLREVSVHYAKKGDLLYPLLKVRYGITGPSDVMWTVDDEIRDELGALEKSVQRDEAWNQRLAKVVQRAEEMIYKEENILFPICAVNFTAEEWYGIYRDSADYADCLGVEKEPWPEATEVAEKAATLAEGEVVMPGGHLTVAQLTAMLNTIPVELTFVDDNNINRYFNEGPKVFKRPAMALDREVWACHPPKIETMVRTIIEDFREGRRDQVPVWMDKGGKPFLVTYMAVRDARGQYLGTVEVVQDMSAAQAHFAKQGK